MIWFYSDPHFGHKNVIRYCDRPFKDITEMREKLIKRWNACVKMEDTVYVLGDVFFCGKQDAKKIMSRLNGTKILIRGNHDRSPETMINLGFHAVFEKAEMLIAKKLVRLCHFPYRLDMERLPQAVQAEIARLKEEQKRTGQDSMMQLDNAIRKFHDQGVLSTEQMNHLIAHDLRFFHRRWANEGGWLLCGHVHEKWKQLDKMINVGCDVWDYRPVSLDKIRNIIANAS